MAEEQTQPVQEQTPVQETPVESNVPQETSAPTTTEPAPRPEYIPEKFWNTEKGELNVEEFGKSYTNLEKYVGGKKDELRDVIIDELNHDNFNEKIITPGDALQRLDDIQCRSEIIEKITKGQKLS